MLEDTLLQKVVEKYYNKGLRLISYAQFSVLEVLHMSKFCTVHSFVFSCRATRILLPSAMLFVFSYTYTEDALAVRSLTCTNQMQCILLKKKEMPFAPFVT